MAGKIQLKIVTPTGVMFTEEVDEFTAPSVSGQFGVLPSHRPLLAGIKTGIVSYRIGNQESQVAVGEGFAKVEDDQANILTRRFISKSDVDPIVARKDLKVSQDALDKLTSESDEKTILELIGATRWAATCLELYGDPPPATIVLDQEMRLLSGTNRYNGVEEQAAEETKN